MLDDEIPEWLWNIWEDEALEAYFQIQLTKLRSEELEDMVWRITERYA